MEREKPSRQQEMSFTAEAVRAELRQRVRDITALAPEDSRQAALRFTASVLKLPYIRVKRWYYDEVSGSPPAHEADQIRAYYEQAKQLIDKRAEFEAQRRAFIAAHPVMGRLAPPTLPPVETQPALKRKGRK